MCLASTSSSPDRGAQTAARGRACPPRQDRQAARAENRRARKSLQGVYASRRRRQRFPAARPSGVARKCSSGTWRKAVRASASTSPSSPSRSSASMRIRRPWLPVSLGRDGELAVDGHRPPVAHEDPCGHRREPIPRGEEAAGLVERGGDEAAVHDPGAGLVARPEGERRLVALAAFFGRSGRPSPPGVSPHPQHAGSWCGGIGAQRSPPRSKCAR